MRKNSMRKNVAHSLAITLLAMLVTGCASAPPSVDSSSSAEVTFDGLNEVLNSSADQAWARSDIDLSGYSKIMLQGVGIEYRPGGESGRTSISRSQGGPFEVTEEQKARFENVVSEAFREELARSERFEIVDKPGPDVLMIRGALLDVVSYVPPEPIGRGDIYLSSVGEATLVLEIRDSMTNTIMARAIDRDAAENMTGLSNSNRVTNRSEVRRLVQRWARALREGLEAFAN